MVETATEEKVPLEAKNKPFMVCGFLGVFWNLSYGSEDHLGSTRMVLDENGTVKEALMYQPYGAVSDVQGITTPGNDPLRQKFTTKEFDEEGDENGAPGIDAYHFGFRVYDPDIGVWMSTDPKDQDFNVYGYCNSNPIILVDPNGEFWNVVGAIAGAAIGAYAGGAIANGSLNPGKWEWDDAGTWTGMIGGSSIGFSMGYGIGSQIDASLFARTMNSPLGRNVMRQGGIAGLQRKPMQLASNVGGGVVDATGVSIIAKEIYSPVLAICPECLLSPSINSGPTLGVSPFSLSRTLSTLEKVNTGLSYGFVGATLFPEPTTSAIGIIGLTWTSGAALGIDVAQAALGYQPWSDVLWSGTKFGLTYGMGEIAQQSYGVYKFSLARFVDPKMQYIVKTAPALKWNATIGVYNLGIGIIQ